MRTVAISFLLTLALARCSSAPASPDVSTSGDVVDTVDVPDSPSDTPDVGAPDADAIDEPWMPPASCLDAATSPDPPDANDAASSDATADASPSDAAADALDAAPPGDASVSVSGIAFNFTTTGGVIPGAYVSPFEHPERCIRTNASGYFRLDGFAPGEDVSLVMFDPVHPLIQTSTETVGAGGLEKLGFQAPDEAMYNLLQLVTHTHAQPDRCQIATTVMQVGFYDYDITGPSHGEAGAVVTLDPPTPAADGPIYFQWLAPGNIVPDRTLTQTSRDGGVLFLNVPPGDYTLNATKPGVTFRPVRIRCRAGLVVNAAPPWGIQAM